MMSLSASSQIWIATLSGKSGTKMKFGYRKQKGRRILMPILIQLLLHKLIRSIHHQVLSSSSILKAKPRRKAISACFSKRAISISSNVPSYLFSQAFRPPNSVISPAITA